MKFQISPLVIIVVALFVWVGEVEARQYAIPPVRVFSHASPLSVKKEFPLFHKMDVGGANVAVGDLTGDNIEEIIVTESLGKAPRVRVFDNSGNEISSFLAYDSAFGRGVTVAVGDLNGDGSREIITGTEYRGSAHIRVYSRDGEELFTQGGFYAFQRGFRGGVNIAAADVDGDGKDEIIAGAGSSGGPHVRIFSESGLLEGEFFAFEATMTEGISVAGGDVDGDGKAEIIVSRQGYGTPEVRIFRMGSSGVVPVRSFMAYAEDFWGGVEVVTGDTDMDGIDEIITAPNGNGGAHVRVFNGLGNVKKQFFAYDKNDNFATRVAVGDTDGDGNSNFVTALHYPLVTKNKRDQNWIEVDLGRQQLFAWENGRLANTFLISSGLDRFPSPRGEFSVFRKLPTHDYIWTYGPGNPNNYNLPDVKWNLNFKKYFYIHYAYWHNNFGNQMSHGCINAPLDAARWIYDWSDMGTPVVVHS